MPDPVRTFDDVLPATFDALARGGIAASQAGLPVAVRLFHHHLLRMFLQNGRPPTAGALTAPARRLGLDPHDALALLAEADLVHTDSTGSRVVIAYPLSGRPSPHQVIMGSGVTLAAMCAVDALGIPIMAGDTATISSADPSTGQPIRIHCDNDAWIWEPDTAVVLLAAEGNCSGPIANACAHTAFHVTADQAQAYLAGHPTRIGRVLGQAEAVEIAEAEFGPLLRPWDDPDS